MNVTRARGVVARACLAVLAATGVLAIVPGSAARPAPRASVIVQSTGDVDAARAAVERAGGVVGDALPIVDGFAASVPSDSLDHLQESSSVRAVTPDERVHVAASTDGSEIPATLKSVFVGEVGADRLWGEGVRGAGVRVALIDTGVTPVADLADRLVRVKDPDDPDGEVDCVDLSGEGTCRDTYGHGTFVAGLIAGTGVASERRFTGVAPEAEIVSIKIAGADGSADVSKVLAAIQWVVSFAPDYDIGVLNLSLGTNSTISYRFDPLNFAVERAWQAGIAVVVSASNRGPGAGTISKPADDPLVITVGAVDDRETPALSDDRLPAFSGRGPTAADGLAKPDVVAPGGRVVSLKSPGSTIEQQIGGGLDDVYRRGSGTSMSAGITSGAVALIRQANPDWTPDRIKFALMSTAERVAERDPLAVGAGLVDAYDAARNAVPGVANTDVEVLSDGSGDLDGSRGTVLVTGHCGVLEELQNPDCDVQNGGETAQDHAWDGEEYTSSDWTGSSWYSSQWSQLLGSSWYGSSWYGELWQGSSWYGSSWYGHDDDTISYGATVNGSSWYGAWG